jgi:hypothetical protein
LLYFRKMPRLHQRALSVSAVPLMKKLTGKSSKFLTPFLLFFFWNSVINLWPVFRIRKYFSQIRNRRIRDSELQIRIREAI